MAISETIVGWLEEADGKLTFNEIEQAMPHLTAEALEGIREHFLPEVDEAEVGGVPCWRSKAHGKDKMGVDLLEQPH